MGILTTLNKVKALQKVKAEADRARRERDACHDIVQNSEGLFEFVPRINRRFEAPRHLEPLVVELERAWTQPTRITACAPPRHGKTETVLAFIALTLLKYPWLTLAYVTYEAHIAQGKSRKARQMARDAGVKIAEGANTLSEWRTPQGGGLLATGIGGPLTSQGVNILLIDDPYKNRVQAESGAYRRMSSEWMDDVGETRVEPGGSVFIFHTRWHTDDLIGHVHSGDAGDTWKHVLMPALTLDGRPLWPSRWPRAALEEKRRRVGEYTWASLYQGTPRPRGGSVFGEPTFYEDVPILSYRDAIGLDLAYSEDKLSDWSVAVVMRRCEDKFFVLEVHRFQIEQPDFADKVKAIQARFPRATTRIYAGGTEKGGLQFFRRLGVTMQELAPVGDKFQRAQPVAAQWKLGNVLVPAEAEWVDDYLGEMTSFTGLKDKNDDQVDATAAAFDVLDTGGSMKIDTPVRSRREGMLGY